MQPATWLRHDVPLFYRLIFAVLDMVRPALVQSYWLHRARLSPTE